MSTARSRQLHALTPSVTAGDYHELVGRSPAMRDLYERIERFAPTPLPVLLLGETGTGKEVVARTIAQISGLGGAFVPVNCGALPPTLIESELFGHEQGAFTGAMRRHVGILARADGGVLFLDEIGELPVSTQAKFFRALETGEFSPIGASRICQSRFRLIAATNRDLAALVERKRFRPELLHRLGVVRIRLPPLRERLDDLPALAASFLAGFREEVGSGPERLSGAGLRLCRSYPWPGNIREFKHVMHAAAALTRGDVIEADILREFLELHDPRESVLPAAVPTLDERVRLAEMEAIQEALQRTGGDRAQAAALLGISVSKLYRRLGQNGNVDGRPVADGAFPRPTH